MKIIWQQISAELYAELRKQRGGLSVFGSGTFPESQTTTFGLPCSETPWLRWDSTGVDFNYTDHRYFVAVGTTE